MYKDPEVYDDSGQTILTELINMDTITEPGRAGVGTIETRRLTHEYIMNQSSLESRPNAVMIALGFVSTGTEALVAIATEA